MKRLFFSDAMVQAILDDRKTQTRRVVTPQPYDTTVHGIEVFCPYGQPGDVLTVAEAHAIVPTTAFRCSTGVQQTVNPNHPSECAVYRTGWTRCKPLGRWRPSIHMPVWAARIHVRLTDVRVERVQDISGFDALREGVTLPQMPRILNVTPHPIVEFMALWDNLNTSRGYEWASNPWVWVLAFERVQEG